MTCQKTSLSGKCEIKWNGTTGITTKEIDLKDMKYAELKTTEDSEGDDTYTVIIKTNSGESIPFTPYSSSAYDRKQHIIKEINDFIGINNKYYIQVEEDDRLFIFLFGGIFSLVGFSLIVIVSQVTIFLDKRVNKLTIMKHSILLGKKYLIYKLDNIDNVIVNSSHSSDGDTYRIEFIMKSGEVIPLTSYYSSGKSEKDKTAKRIIDFLRVSTMERISPIRH
jgi:hypothetical protein